ncbi:MAG: AraC-like DNA-binding protein [Arenicella sp.]|jgi:AraC-like DNA-binding protein
MLLLQAFLKFSSIGVLLALVLLILRDGRHIRALQFALPLAVSLICLFLSTGHPDISVTGRVAIPLRLIDMFSFIFVWWFGLALFDDEFKLAWLEFSVAALYIVMHLPGRLHYMGFNNWWYPPLEVAVSAIGFMMMAHLSYVAISGHREDLVESRRKMRKYFVIAIALLIVVSILLERLADSVGIDKFMSMFFIYLFTLPLSLWAVMWLTKLDPERLAFPPSKPKTDTQGIDPRDQQAHQRLVSVMQDQHAYAEHGLSIGKLSQRVGLPPHQLRSLINQSMGYRNYTAFLNHYRITAVKADLTDLNKGRIPILTLAIEAGFSSLAPFNRAFKDSEGITPTDYRSQQLRKSSVT